jgi:hypothetical protein
MKMCALCHETLPPEAFSSSKCKTCKSCKDTLSQRRRAPKAKATMPSHKCPRCKKEQLGSNWWGASSRLCIECRTSTVRICPRCSKKKHRSQFSVSNNAPDGLQTYCKDCNALAYTPQTVSLDRQGIPRRKPCIQCRRTLPAKAFTLHKPGQLSLACIECTNKETK